MLNYMNVIFKIIFLSFLIMHGTAEVFSQDTSYTNAVGMEFVFIKPGSMVVGRFQPAIGKPPAANATPKVLALYKLAEKMAREDAMPGFTVNMNQPYYMGRHEVTQEQWEKVMKSNPSVFKKGETGDDFKKHPVENIKWQDTQAFITKLNDLDKNHMYRLPTEFEWEFAARAGAQDDIPWSQIRLSAVLSGAHPERIATKMPNAWGLYDMLGNVWEWAMDYYNEKIFADPVPPTNGKQHVLKGASFTGDVKNATYMTHAAGPGNGFDIGFRVVMVMKMKSHQ
jgi:formylglycine-generating enzyme required for sulfatase activity